MAAGTLEEVARLEADWLVAHHVAASWNARLVGSWSGRSPHDHRNISSVAATVPAKRHRLDLWFLIQGCRSLPAPDRSQPFANSG